MTGRDIAPTPERQERCVAEQPLREKRDGPFPRDPFGNLKFAVACDRKEKKQAYRRHACVLHVGS